MRAHFLSLSRSLSISLSHEVLTHELSLSLALKEVVSCAPSSVVLCEAQRVPEEVSRFLATTHEAQRVPEEVSRFLATSAEVQLQQPEITGLAMLVAFTLHVPVQRDGECEHEHYGGVLVLSAAGGERF